MPRMNQMLTWAPALCLVWSLQAEDAPKRSQRNEAAIPVVKSQKAGDTAAAAASVSDRAIAASGEVVATNFTVQAGNCVRVNSFLDYISSSNRSIFLPSYGQNITTTAILSFFSVDGHPFLF